jgi:putative membrane protein
MLEQKYTFKHAIIFTILAVTLVIASIHPLQYPDYLLHQAGTVFMLIALCYCFKKLGLIF